MELVIDPARVRMLDEQPVLFESNEGGRYGSRLVIYVVEDVDGVGAEVVFVGHTRRGDKVTIQRQEPR